jgi:hypothetical protein
MTAFQHSCRCCAAQRKGGEEVRLNHSLKFRVTGGNCRLFQMHTRVVDQNGKWSVSDLGLGNQSGDTRRVGDVRRKKSGIGAEFPASSLKRFGAATNNRNARAGGHETPGHCQTKSGATAGDQRVFSFE